MNGIEKPNKEGGKMTGEKLVWMEPKDLVPTADNPRGKVDTKSESFRDLVASIKADGVKVPGQARPIAGKRQYELLDGARRLAACIACERPMPVVVHGDLDDAEAFKIVLASNFAREDR